MNFDSSTGKKVSLSKLFNQPVTDSYKTKVLMSFSKSCSFLYDQKKFLVNYIDVCERVFYQDEVENNKILITTVESIRK